jgi:hypothetical protein
MNINYTDNTDNQSKHFIYEELSFKINDVLRIMIFQLAGVILEYLAGENPWDGSFKIIRN